METVFKVGDEVFDIRYGWGTVKEAGKYSKRGLYVAFEKNTASYYSNGAAFDCVTPTLSFTEYTLQGFSQERSLVLPEVGEFCLVRDSYDEDWKCVKFKLYNRNTLYPFTDSDNDDWKQMKRIKILD
jgi:hypothetical protein